MNFRSLFIAISKSTTSLNSHSLFVSCWLDGISGLTELRPQRIDLPAAARTSPHSSQIYPNASRLVFGSYLGFIFVLFSATASAQVGTEPLAWAPQNRHIADALGTWAVAGQIGANTLASWKAEDRKHAFIVEGCSLGIAFGASQLLKTFIHEERPNGVDDKSFPSMHSALGAAAAWKHFEFSVPVAAFIGLSRSAANWHHLWPDVAAGWAIGAGAQVACRALAR